MKTYDGENITKRRKRKVNNQGTLAKLGEMKLHGMTRAFRATMETGLKQNFSADELVAHLVDTE